jgi:hypothetical protein
MNKAQFHPQRISRLHNLQQGKILDPAEQGAGPLARWNVRFIKLFVRIMSSFMGISYEVSRINFEVRQFPRTPLGSYLSGYRYRMSTSDLSTANHFYI